MTLRDRLIDEMKSAMKSRDELKLSAIRLIRSAVKNKEIEAKHELDDQGVTEVISTLVKQRRESIRLFNEAGRDDLVRKEEEELQTLLAFLPQQMSRDEIVSLVNSVIAECGAQGPTDMGKVMKAIQPRVAGRADGKTVSDLVREALV
jgi:uncharacterized protein YqeY